MPTPTDRLLLDIAEGTAAAIGEDFFELLVRYLAQSLEVRAALLTECTDPTLTRVRSLAFFIDGGFAQDIEYELVGTPCRLVIDGSECYIPTDLTQRFPKEEGFDSYLAVPVFGVAHEVLGHLAVLDDAPMVGGDRHFAVLRIFAARAGAELERLRAESALRAALSELERLKNRLQQENSYLQEEIERGHDFRAIVGHSPALAQALGRAEQVAPTDATVLILGETGTGKELVARAIHDRSARKDRPLVKVNCAALPAALIESELFGHEKGAFTGAHTRRIGRFELADGGTLFLDEVGELPLELQAKLLRVLQEGEFERLGGSASKRVDVRVIAATNRDLAAAVQDGSFRADLFYRLNVVPIRVPPLRERREDVPDLVRSFVARFARKTGRPINRIPAAVMEQLQAYAWPGNVRELQNVIERAVVLAPDDTLLLDEAFSVSARTGHTPPRAPSAPDLTPGLTLDELQRRYIRQVLADTGGKIAGRDGAAERLGLNPNTLRSRMQKLGVGRQGEPP